MAQFKMVYVYFFNILPKPFQLPFFETHISLNDTFKVIRHQLRQL